MSSPELKLANTSVCPRCGAGLRCGMVRSAGQPQTSTAPSGGSLVREATSVGADTLAGDAECWCAQLPNVMPVPSALPVPALPDNSAASCFCPACLKQITDERQNPLSAAGD
jgi:uncharacterized paraquat-inducible protein A